MLRQELYGRGIWLLYLVRRLVECSDSAGPVFDAFNVIFQLRTNENLHIPHKRILRNNGLIKKVSITCLMPTSLCHECARSLELSFKSLPAGLYLWLQLSK